MGSAIAQEYAGKNTRLFLWGRNQAALEQCRRACEAKGAVVTLIRQDLQKSDDAKATLLQLDAQYPLDVAFLNAGVSSGATPASIYEPAADACRTMSVNGLSTVCLSSFLLEKMHARQKGHLVFIASLAALYPLPSSAAYSAAKVAVAYYAKALRAAGGPVRISLVYPGYVDTPMSRRLSGPQPFTWSAAKAAAYICQRLAAGADTIVFPKLLALGTVALHFLPACLANFFVRRFSFTVEPDKESPAYKGDTPS